MKKTLIKEIFYKSRISIEENQKENDASLNWK